jgi:hypothetical protein
MTTLGRMAARKPPIDWSSTPNSARHSKPIEVTLAPDERSILDRFAGDRERSAVVGAALMALARLTGRQIDDEIAAAKARRRKPGGEC